MKSLKEFIAENLENSTVPTVQENTEKPENNQDKASTDKTNENNENILHGQTSNEDSNNK